MKEGEEVYHKYMKKTRCEEHQTETCADCDCAILRSILHFVAVCVVLIASCPENQFIAIFSKQNIIIVTLRYYQI